MKLFNLPHGDEPCSSCMALMSAEHDQLAVEMVLPVPEGAFAPLSRTQKTRDGKPRSICFDCAAAEGLMRLMEPEGKKSKVKALSFPMARVAVGSDRREMLRLPGIRLGATGARPSSSGDFDTLLDWQRRTLGDEEARALVRADMQMEKLRSMPEKKE